MQERGPITLILLNNEFSVKTIAKSSRLTCYFLLITTNLSSHL